MIIIKIYVIDNEHEIEKIIQNLKRNKTLIPMVVDDFLKLF